MNFKKDMIKYIIVNKIVILVYKIEFYNFW